MRALGGTDEDGGGPTPMPSWWVAVGSPLLFIGICPMTFLHTCARCVCKNIHCCISFVRILEITYFLCDKTLVKCISALIS